MQWLLAHGFNPNYPSSANMYPVHYAAGAGNLPILDLLVGAGAGVDVCDERGNTPLHYVCTKQVAEYLVQRGAALDARGTQGNTVLHNAAEAGNPEVVAYFLSLGVSASDTDIDGMTPADWAQEALSVLEEDEDQDATEQVSQILALLQNVAY